MKFGKSEKDITPHLLIAAIAAMLLYVAASWWAGSGESQQSAPAPEAKPVEPIAEVPAQPSPPPAAVEPPEPIAEAAKAEPSTAKAPATSIHDAAMDGDIEAVKQHLADGTDVNAKGQYGRTPLHKAANKEIAELLIANGAEVNAMDVLLGWTPLDYAEGETADLLRKHGAKTSEQLKAEGK